MSAVLSCPPTPLRLQIATLRSPPLVARLRIASSPGWRPVPASSGRSVVRPASPALLLIESCVQSPVRQSSAAAYRPIRRLRTKPKSRLLPKSLPCRELLPHDPLGIRLCPSPPTPLPHPRFPLSSP